MPAISPSASGVQPGAKAKDRLFFPLRRELLGAAIARRVVRRGVVAEAIGQRFQQSWAAAAARALYRAPDRVAYGDQIVAVDLLAGDAGGDRLLRQRLRRALHAARNGDGVLVVDDDHDQRQIPGAGGVDRLVEIALGGRAIAAHRKRDARLATQLHRVSHTGRVRHLRADRHVERKVVGRLGEDVAALVAAPVEERAVRRDAAQHEHAAFAVARQQHVVPAEHGADAGVDRLLAQGGGVSADLAGALHRNSLGVERAHENHGAIIGHQSAGIAGKRGKSCGLPALRVKVAGKPYLEGGGDGHRCPFRTAPSLVRSATGGLHV